MIDHAQDLQAVREATARLLATVTPLDNAALSAPSRLPGWTRGHVLAHLARNADALVNVLAGRPMYPSAEARDADIERDAQLPAAELLAGLRAAADRFLEQAATPADWNRTVTLRNGVTDSAARVPFRRLAEVELHHVDLGLGYELEDVPADFTLRYTAFLADRFSGHPDVPPMELDAPGAGHWRTGGTEGDPLKVTGTPAALLGWLAGRRDGAELDAGGVRPPALPAL
ncbi:maleylpyruvate isomerase family mycothiol-dependent enzyme [Streptomyces mashuensis]|nr:maleylpyruvate isomerase family mycothiol-dependent enzyme [Streptomyces mashuensis]